VSRRLGSAASASTAACLVGTHGAPGRPARGH
jgi:hypothetical protein